MATRDRVLLGTCSRRPPTPVPPRRSGAWARALRPPALPRLPPPPVLPARCGPSCSCNPRNPRPRTWIRRGMPPHRIRAQGLQPEVSDVVVRRSRKSRCPFRRETGRATHRGAQVRWHLRGRCRALPPRRPAAAGARRDAPGHRGVGDEGRDRRADRPGPGGGHRGYRGRGGLARPVARRARAPSQRGGGPAGRACGPGGGMDRPALRRTGPGA